jgi:steroid Delta-isomerase
MAWSSRSAAPPTEPATCEAARRQGSLRSVNTDEHIATFNEAVVTGDWDAFVSRFDDNASVEFVGPPVGPFIGRAAIAAAYTSSPPDDTISSNGEAYKDDGELIVPYRWATSGATGTMRFTERDGRIARLVITFD